MGETIENENRKNRESEKRKWEGEMKKKLGRERNDIKKKEEEYLKSCSSPL